MLRMVARDKAIDARRMVKEGINPIDARRAARFETATADAAAVTFGEFADSWVEDMVAGFKNEKHRWQWRQTFKMHAASLRPLPIDSVETDHIRALLKPMWSSKQETASRVRGRIEKALDAAKSRGLRTGENPARWRGHLENLLPRRNKLQRGHHPALPYHEMPKFIEALRKRRAISARALEFTILTASRTGEVIGAKWSEINRKKALWVIPASRMKAEKEHRVPLSHRAIAILGEVELLKCGDLVFPGQKQNKPLSNMAMSQLLERMKYEHITVHGFRSSFRDWVGDATHFSSETAEAALAHSVGNETARAYRRGDSLEKRRTLMAAWESFITTVNHGSTSAISAV